MKFSERITFEIEITGASAHASTPHLGHDAILAASSIVLACQSLVSRVNDPRNPLALNLGTVKAGKQFNIIADSVLIGGLLLAQDKSQGEMIFKQLKELVNSVALGLGCRGVVQVKA